MIIKKRKEINEALSAIASIMGKATLTFTKNYGGDSVTGEIAFNNPSDLCKTKYIIKNIYGELLTFNSSQIAQIRQ